MKWSGFPTKLSEIPGTEFSISQGHCSTEVPISPRKTFSTFFIEQQWWIPKHVHIKFQCQFMVCPKTICCCSLIAWFLVAAFRTVHLWWMSYHGRCSVNNNKVIFITTYLILWLEHYYMQLTLVHTSTRREMVNYVINMTCFEYCFQMVYIPTTGVACVIFSLLLLLLQKEFISH